MLEASERDEDVVAIHLPNWVFKNPFYVGAGTEMRTQYGCVMQVICLVYMATRSMETVMTRPGTEMRTQYLPAQFPMT